MDRQPFRACGPLDATLDASPSKSVTHRTLVAAALAHGESVIHHPLDSDDTRVTLAGLAVLGAATRIDAGAWRVQGGHPTGGGAIQLRDSGTSCRLLTAVAALGAERTSLDGSARLRARPIAPLVEALTALGARVEASPVNPPFPLIAGGRSFRGGEVAVDGSDSSQYASALMLIAPLLAGGLRLHLEGSVSLPYLDLTAAVMRRFGAVVRRLGDADWQIEPGGYSPCTLEVEGDHSSASYFLSAPLLAGGRVRVGGLDPHSTQPDACLGSILTLLGAHVATGEDWIEVRAGGSIRPLDLDMRATPDLVPTVAALCLFAEEASTIRGVAHLRVKESDRLQVLAENIRALGGTARVERDRLEISPAPKSPRPARIRTGSDHRIAMAFALAGLAAEGTTLDDPDCVSKSNPRFWDQWSSLAPLR